MPLVFQLFDQRALGEIAGGGCVKCCSGDLPGCRSMLWHPLPTPAARHLWPWPPLPHRGSGDFFLVGEAQRSSGADVVSRQEALELHDRAGSPQRVKMPATMSIGGLVVDGGGHLRLDKKKRQMSCIELVLLHWSQIRLHPLGRMLHRGGSNGFVSVLRALLALVNVGLARQVGGRP